MNTKEYAISILNTLSDEQLNKIIELILVFQNEKNEKNFHGKKFEAMGILNEYANPEMIQFEKGAWERAVVEKYAETHNS